jgi:DNA-binding response OmpR family regulator
MDQIAAVLCVNDNAGLVEFMRSSLTLIGFRVKIVTSMQEVAYILEHSSIDASLLEMMDIEQFEASYKSQGDERAIILIVDCEECMEVFYGWNEKYRKKDIKAINHYWKGAARLETMTSYYQYTSSSRQQSSIFNFGRLVIDVDAYEVRVEGVPVQLTDREFALLRLLIEHPRKVFTHEQLFKEIWGEDGDRRALSIYIGRIRKKIENEPGRPRYIVTIWGVGYRFDGRRR